MASPLVANAGTGTDDNTVGTLAWSALNAMGSANATAAYTLSTLAGQVTHRNLIPFDVSSLPNGATIVGIRVQLVADVYSAFARSATDTQVQLMLGGVTVGNNKGGGNTIVGSTPDNWATYTYGGATDLWGLDESPGTLTVAAMKAATNLLAVYATYGSGAGSTYFQIDHAILTVYYTEGTAARARTFRGFMEGD